MYFIKTKLQNIFAIQIAYSGSLSYHLVKGRSCYLPFFISKKTLKKFCYLKSGCIFAFDMTNTIKQLEQKLQDLKDALKDKSLSVNEYSSMYHYTYKQIQKLKN